LWQGGFSEQAPPGASSAAAAVALQYAGASQVSLPVTLGARAEGEFALGPQTALIASVKLGWTHQFQATTSLRAAFAQSPSVVFTTDGIPAVSDTADLRGRISLLRTGGSSITIQAQSQLSPRLATIAGALELVQRF
jgi:uncharacterized protein with beta-barrel porin domain